MRKIIAMEFYSLDGLMSDPEDRQDWVTDNFTADMGEYVDEVFAASDTLILGATTYKIMAAYWPTAATNPNAFEGDAEFASTINSMKKLVFSKAPLTPEWSGSEFVSEIDADDIRRRKEAPGKHMLIQGSASVVQQLTSLGLIDEYHLLVHPVILGQGKPLFAGVEDRRRLKLAGTKTFENGVVLLHYLLAE
ncbi:MAG TPA: dihydrofolate reductase family protein [Aggregatilineales bacterium]|nr:dihydrofolate reductase family protein [Chloroflexota bacterium]HOA23787.1 dihydrofolate reductase family protein [Aggregatilineales bacterium]HQA66687.1 dihydrofolate reductase family protein [Aggregatilineales bacterium]HQE17869.1 dihydrofolate reductase family protein [Aggregatilineales bacterium]